MKTDAQGELGATMGLRSEEMAEPRCHDLRWLLFRTDIFHRIGCASLKWVDK